MTREQASLLLRCAMCADCGRPTNLDDLMRRADGCSGCYSDVLEAYQVAFPDVDWAAVAAEHPVEWIRERGLP